MQSQFKNSSSADHASLQGVMANMHEIPPVYQDPPVEKLPKVRQNDFIDLIEIIRHDYQQGDMNEVRSKIRLLGHHFLTNRVVQLLGDGVLKEVCKRTDLVPFMLQLGAQKDDVETSCLAANLLMNLILNSNYAIDEALSDGAFEFFRQLLIHPFSNVQVIGFWIVAHINRTEQGAKLCYSRDILSLMCQRFHELLDDLSEVHRLEILKAISQAFRYFGDFIQKFPKSARMSIFSCYADALDRDLTFAPDALQFCWSVVTKLRDEGIIAIFDSFLMTKLAKITETTETELIVYLCEVICRMFYVKNTEVRNGLVHQIDLNSFLRIFVESRDSRLLKWSVRVLINISSVSKCFDWFFTEAVQQKIATVFDSGSFPEKTSVVSVVFMVMGLGTHFDIQRLFETDLPISALSLLQSCPTSDRITGLRAVHNALEQITRFGLRSDEKFQEFQDQLVSVLKQDVSDDTDRDVQRLAECLLETNFPDTFYQMNLTPVN